MPFDLSDFDLTDIPANKDLSFIVHTLMDSVAFCVYDSHKVKEIFERMKADLQTKHRIQLDYNIEWHAPSIDCEVSKLPEHVIPGIWD